MYNYPDELYHHGIKGQRWGVRNGPPYPLTPQTHASVVRSAGRGGSGKKKAEGNKKYLNPRIKGIDDEADKKARRKRIARNIAIGAGATAAAAGLGYLAYKNRQKLLSRRPKGSSQPMLNGPVQSPWERAKVVGDGSGTIVPVRSVGKAAPNYKANMGKTGRKVRSIVTPTPGSGKKFKFTSRSTGTSIVPANTNRQLGFLKEDPRRLNWRRVAAAAGGAAALGGGTAAGISAYRRRKSRKRRR